MFGKVSVVDSGRCGRLLVSSGVKTDENCLLRVSAFPVEMVGHFYKPPLIRRGLAPACRHS